MGLTAEQRSVARAFNREADRLKATPKERQALFEAGIVESNLRRLSYGDRDSVGPLQERSHYGSTQRRMNAGLSARRFLGEARTLTRKGFSGSSGNLAQAVQRSAFPDRYDKVGDRAAQIAKGSGSGSDGSDGGSRTTVRQTGTGLEAGANSGLTAALAALNRDTETRRSSRGIAAPAFLAQVRGPQGALQVPSSGAPAKQESSISAALEALAANPSDASLPKTTSTATTTRTGGGGGGGSRRRGGKVDLSPRGGWKGTNGPISDLSRLAQGVGLKVISSKRDTKATASGGVSDHWVGSGNATARDLSNGSAPTKEMDEAAYRIAREIGIPYKKGTPIATSKVVDGIRYQVIYRSNVGGNHFNHVHVGAKRV